MLFAIIVTFIIAAVLLAWFLLVNDRGEKEPILVLWLAAGFGVAGAFSAATLEGWLIPAGNLQQGAPQFALLGAAMTIGVVEELCKFLPLAVFIYKRRYFNEHTDGVIYFALAGLGFGLPENILYTVQHGAETGLMRLFLTPILHAGITGLVGYYLARCKMAGKNPLLVAVPLVSAMVLHGLYDFGLLSGVMAYQMASLVITVSISAGLFMFYLSATEKDQERGVSAVGHNAFCRSCGFANPRHHLYCVQCGKNA